MLFDYPITLTAEKPSGFVITFVDLPEAMTSSETEDELDIFTVAQDALDEAIAGRMIRAESIPLPSLSTQGQMRVPLSAQMAAKAALYVAMKESGFSKSDLADELQCDEKEARRLLDPHHPSKLPRIEQALACLGRHLVVGVV
jgi:antitoxin HicB